MEKLKSIDDIELNIGDTVTPCDSYAEKLSNWCNYPVTNIDLKLKMIEISDGIIKPEWHSVKEFYSVDNETF